MVGNEREQLQQLRQIAQQRGPAVPYPSVDTDERDTDSFDIDIRISSRPRPAPADGQPVIDGSIFGSCHSCRCSGPGCR